MTDTPKRNWLGIASYKGLLHRGDWPPPDNPTYRKSDVDDPPDALVCDTCAEYESDCQCAATPERIVVDGVEWQIEAYATEGARVVAGTREGWFLWVGAGIVGRFIHKDGRMVNYDTPEEAMAAAARMLREEEE